MTFRNGTPGPTFVHPGPGQGGPNFPKRFYSDVTVLQEPDGFAVRLDGRRALTPARHPLALPTVAMAEKIAQEWNAVEVEIDPRQMPHTRLANSVIDGVGSSQPAVLADVTRYATSDLLVYRAGEPERLVQAQAAAWDPIVTWSRDTFGAPLILAEGVMFVAQPEPTLQRLSQAVADLVGNDRAAPFRLGALHVMTTLTGSVLLAAAVAARRLSWEEAWAAAHVDEDYQNGEWGEDAEAAERRSKRAIEMRVAANLYELSR